MDCIIQVFPDEFHLETLEVFLGVLPKLRDKVNTRTILNNMMERLLHYYQDETLVDGELDTNDVKKAMAINSFDMFEDCVQRVFEARGLNIPPKDVIRLQGCLLNYALKISPGNIELISRCIGMCAGALGALKEQKKASMMGQGIVVGGGTTRSSEIDMESVATAALESLLSVPLDQLALTVLDLPDFSVLLSFLPWENRKVVALSMVKSVVAGGDGAKVKDVAQLEQLLEILAPLLRDKGASGPASFEPAVDDGGSLISRTANLMGTLGINSSDNDVFNGGIQKAESFGGDVQRANQFRQEQTLVAKLVHVLDHEDTDVAYQMLNIARKHITPGGPKRASMTLPPIIFEALLLLRRVQAMEFPPPVASQKETEPENAEEESKDIAESEDTKEGEDAITNEDEEETQSAVDEKTEAKAEDSNNDGDPAENGEPEENSSPDDGVNEGETVDAEADVTDKASAPEESIAKEPKTEESSSEEAAPLFPPFNKSVK
jgi:vacuolar protein sorting-associated protein 35